jgi:hypothetical protein
MVRVHAVTSYQQYALNESWELLAVAPDSYATPEQLQASANPDWQAAIVPGTVMETLQKNQHLQQCRLREAGLVVSLLFRDVSCRAGSADVFTF